MPKEYSRAQRVGDYIGQELARLIQFEVRDPRVQMANINEVQVTRDMSLAKVYVTFIGVNDDKACEEAAAVLNKAAGFLRTKIASDNTMRITPKLRFYYDRSVREGAQLTKLIERAIKEDASHHMEDGKD